MTHFNQGWLLAELSSAREEFDGWTGGLRESFDNASEKSSQMSQGHEDAGAIPEGVRRVVQYS